MDDEDLQKLEHVLREHNQIDWVLVAHVMTEAANLGYPATEDTAISTASSAPTNEARSASAPTATRPREASCPGRNPSSTYPSACTLP